MWSKYLELVEMIDTGWIEFNTQPACNPSTAKDWLNTIITIALKAITTETTQFLETICEYRYSPLAKLVRVTTCCLRFTPNNKLKRTNQTTWFRYKATRYKQFMGNLTRACVSPSLAFLHSGVVYAGHIKFHRSPGNFPYRLF